MFQDPFAELDALESDALRNSVGGFRLWLSSHARIKDKDGALVQIVLNDLQKQYVEAIEWCLKMRRPMRFIILKARQVGSSTINMLFVDWFSKAHGKNTLIVGGQMAHSSNLWKILRTSITHDTYQWAAEKAKPGDKQIIWPNGSAAEKGTARDPEEGRSGTYQIIVCTEAARWSEQGVANASEVLAGLLASLPPKPGTLGVMESTARGPAGEFHRIWTDEDSQFLHEAQQDDKGGWIKIFSPWFAFPDYRKPFGNQAARTRFVNSMTTEEKLIQEQFSLDLEQLNWRRHTIRDNCKRDVRIFRREYPSTWQEAFMASSPSYFSAEGLAVARKRASQAELADRRNVLFERPYPDRPVIAISEVPMDQAKWIIYERPLPGRKYIMGADFMEGLTEKENGDNRDNHAVKIWRAGYMSPVSGWIRPRIVAATPKPCQWGDDLIEEEIWRASEYFGRCLIVPERNTGTHIIKGLVERGCHVWEPSRGLDISLETREITPSGKYGIRTTGGGEDTKGTKRNILANLAAEIREHDVEGRGVDLDLLTVQECEVFIQHISGKLAAQNGEHDDQVMAAAIPFSLIDAATIYRTPAWASDSMAMSDPMSRRGRGRRGGGQWSSGY
jgi:hypothetical protein